MDDYRYAADDVAAAWRDAAYAAELTQRLTMDAVAMARRSDIALDTLAELAATTAQAAHRAAEAASTAERAWRRPDGKPGGASDSA